MNDRRASHVVWAIVIAGVLSVLSACLGSIGASSDRTVSDPDAGDLIFPDQDRAGDTAADAFRISEYAPTGIVPWQNLEGGVWVLFSEPVIPMSRLGKPAAESEVLRIHPFAEGIYRWYGSRLLSFEPSASLAPATEYTAVVNHELTSLNGNTLQGMNAFRFRTPALQLLSVEPSGTDVRPEDCRRLLLSFNFPVEPAAISRYLKVEAGERAYTFEAVDAGEEFARIGEGEAQQDDADSVEQSLGEAARGPSAGSVNREADRRILLKMKEELPWDSDVVVRLLKGARPGERSYGTDSEQVMGFHTLEPFRLEYGEVYDWLPSIEAGLIFNHPLAEQDLLDSLKVTVPGYQLRGNVEVYGNTIYLKNLPVEFESAFSVSAAGRLRDLYDQILGQEETVDLEVGPAASYVRFRAAGNRVLEAGFPPVVAVEFQNAISGSYAAGRLQDPLADLPPGSFSDYQVETIPRNMRIFRTVDFSPYLDAGGRGGVYARWRFQVPSWWSDEPYRLEEELRLQITDIGLASHIAYNRISVQAASLSTGDPIAGASVIVHGAGGSTRGARSDAQGRAVFRFQPGELAGFTAGSEKNLRIEVRSANDRLLFDPSASPSHNWNLRGPFEAEQPRAITYLCSDRGIYRPGEIVSFYGIDRDLELGSLRSRSGGYTVDLRQGWYGDTVHASIGGRLSASGRFWGEVRLPERLEPDVYFLVYRRDDGSQIREVPLRVAFFRRVNFAVDLSIPEGPYYMDEDLPARFSGAYLGGGSLRQGKWSYWWARKPLHFSPPDPKGAYRAFRFGVPPDYGYDEYGYYGDYYEELSSAEGQLSGDGVAVASQPLSEGRPGQVYEYTVTATIEDIDRQAVSRQASAPVFTSSLLIGARLTDEQADEGSLYFVGRGEPFTVQLCLLQPDGRPYPFEESRTRAPRIRGRLLRESWRMVRERSIGGRTDTRWVREETEEHSFELDAGKADRGADGLASTELATSRVGSYILELSGEDDRGRQAMTRIDFYSTGSGNVLWRRYDEKRIELVADQPSYSPGQNASLLIKSPLEAGRYLLTVEREGILEERILELSTSTDMVQIPIRDHYIPVVYVTISGARGRSAPPPGKPDDPDLGKPQGYFGMLAVAVDSDHRRIEVDLKSSRSVYRPGAEAEITVTATREGKPLQGAEIAVVAADRGVLDLIDYHLSDPVRLFYDRYMYRHGVAHFDSRELLLDPVLWKARDLPGGDKEGEEADTATPQFRKDFRATAVFEPNLVTGADGTATMRFTLPDQLTTFRATAVAVKDDLFGIAEDEIVVQNPINVRPALPRSLRVGDQAEAGVVVTNLDEQSRVVTVSAQSERIRIKDRAEKRVKVRPGESREIAFSLIAEEEGPAALSFTVISEVLRERLEVSIPVERTAVREAFTVVGQTETNAQEALVVPESFLGEEGEGLEIELDSTLAASLNEAIRFLDTYPHDCLEQRTSKLFAYILFDWLLDDPQRTRTELEALPGYQCSDGGMSFWQDPGYLRSNYYVSLRTAHLLSLVIRGGHTLPEGLDLPALLEYVQREIPAESAYLRSYALWVLSEHGTYRAFVRNGLEAMLAAAETPGVLAQTFTALAWNNTGEQQRAQQQLQRIRGYLRVGTRSVTVSEPVGSWFYYGGQLQAKAALLLLYGRLEPRSQIARALADDLLASTRNGYWQNTSNTGWALQAFASYIDTDRESGTDFRAHVQLGSERFAPLSFSGVSRGSRTLFVDAEQLQRLGEQVNKGEDRVAVEFSKQGQGRLYYTATLRYALDASLVQARDEGIGLYTEILDPFGDPVEGDLKLGEVYKLRYVLYSGRDRDFLALRIPIPAGAEPIDRSLATSQIVQDQQEELRYYGPVERIYDNEVRLYYDTFRRGKREGSFLFRTTTPGTFVVPPAVAELMYEGEVFGRTGGREYRIVP